MAGRRSTPTTNKTLANQLGRAIALLLVLGLVLLLERYCSGDPVSFDSVSKLVAIDGDTLRAGDRHEYRIFGIDAPELHQNCYEQNGKEWACGRAAKDHLAKLISGGDVACQDTGPDRYGRSVSKCSAAGVPDVGEAMVRDGYAVDLGGKTHYAYASVESEARVAGRGIWRGTFQRPSAWRQDHPRTD